MLEQAQGYVHTAKWHSFPVVFWLLISWSSNPVHVNFFPANLSASSRMSLTRGAGDLQLQPSLPEGGVDAAAPGWISPSLHSIWWQPSKLVPPHTSLCSVPHSRLCNTYPQVVRKTPFRRVSTQPLHNSRPFILQKHTGQIFCRVTLWGSLSILCSVHMPALPSEVSPCCCAPFCRGYTWEQVLLGV